MKNVFIKIIIFTLSLFFVNAEARAKSWWGDGARSSEWVLANKGTIIRYKIIANGASDRYKALIFKDGKIVEWENGKSGTFDDPKDGTYIVEAYRGGIKKQKTSKGGRKILSSGPIVAHPGETIYVTLNDITNEVTVTSDRHIKVPAKAVSKTPTPAE